MLQNIQLVKNKDIINKNYDNVKSDKIRLFIEKDPSLKNKNNI